MGWIITSAFCQLRREKYKYREKEHFIFEKQKEQKKKNKNKKINNPSYIYRTLLKFPLMEAEKAFRICTVKLCLKSFFVKVDF